MAEEEIIDITELDCSNYSLEDLIALQRILNDEIQARAAIIKLIEEAMQVNQESFYYSQGVLTHHPRIPVFPLREEEDPAVIKKEIDSQEQCRLENENMKNALTYKLSEVQKLIDKASGALSKQ